MTNTAAASPLSLLHCTRPVEGEVAWAAYAEEVLAHAGLTVTPLAADAPPPRGVIVVTGTPDTGQAERLAGAAATGGVVLLTQGPGAAADIAGVHVLRELGSETVSIEGHTWTQRPPRPLRTLAGQALAPVEDAEVLAVCTGGGTAITRRRVGAGAVITFGVDLWRTIAGIQQGTPVHADGRPASDGTAPIDEGILKAEDGMQLDLETDRAMSFSYVKRLSGCKSRVPLRGRS